MTKDEHGPIDALLSNCKVDIKSTLIDKDDLANLPKGNVDLSDVKWPRNNDNHANLRAGIRFLHEIHAKKQATSATTSEV